MLLAIIVSYFEFGLLLIGYICYDIAKFVSKQLDISFKKAFGYYLGFNDLDSLFRIVSWILLSSILWPCVFAFAISDEFDDYKKQHAKVVNEHLTKKE